MAGGQGPLAWASVRHRPEWDEEQGLTVPAHWASGRRRTGCPGFHLRCPANEPGPATNRAETHPASLKPSGEAFNFESAQAAMRRCDATDGSMACAIIGSLAGSGPRRRG